MKSNIKPLIGARMSGLASVALATIISLCGCVAAQATPIVYTFTGFGSGMLGTNTFTDTSFTITATSDTSRIAVDPFGPLNLQATNLTATVSVSGIGSGTFNGRTLDVEFQNESLIAFLDVQENAAVIITTNAAFSTYNLSSSLGPLNEGPATINPGLQYVTSAGNFSLTDVTGATTFQATVPEPSLAAISALAAAFALLRRRK